MKVKTKIQILRMYKKAVKANYEGRERYSEMNILRREILENVLGLTTSEITEIRKGIMKELGFHPSRIE